MSSHFPEIIKIKSLKDAEREIRKIGSDPESVEIMAPKAITCVIKLKNVFLQDAIIVKQDMLSLGGEVAVPRETFKLVGEKASILVIGTIKQHEELVGKLDRHYERIKKIARELAKTLQEVKKN